MNGAISLWPHENQSFWDITNLNYVVEIKWSQNPFEDYKKLANNYSQCGYLLFNEVIGSGHDNNKSDMWFSVPIFLMRHSIELGLKSLICRVCDKNPEIQTIFIECGHDLSKLFNIYIQKNENYISNAEQEWLRRYLITIVEDDKESDMFRFPFGDKFLAKYRDKYLDNYAVAEKMAQAYSIIEKCINCGDNDSDYEFKVDLDLRFITLANHGIGNCYLRQSIFEDGFRTKIDGYIEVVDFIYYNCENIILEQKLYPLIFMLRNIIELCLKRIFYIKLDKGRKKKVSPSKGKSHCIKRDLWKNVRPTIEYYAKESNQDLSVIDILDIEIEDLENIDKNGDCFRYPTSYSLEYRYNGKKIDVKNVYEYMRAIISSLNGCYSILDEHVNYESEFS